MQKNDTSIRTIRFRGFGTNGNGWIYGSYFKTEGEHSIVEEIPSYDKNGEQLGYLTRTVTEKSVGQYTGLKDKNGVEIYEGDIVDFTTFNHNGIDTQWRGVVKFSVGGWQIWNNGKSPYYDTDGAFELNWVYYQDEEIEVIGNIHDNPELMT